MSKKKIEVSAPPAAAITAKAEKTKVTKKAAPTKTVSEKAPTKKASAAKTVVEPAAVEPVLTVPKATVKPKKAEKVNGAPVAAPAAPITQDEIARLAYSYAEARGFVGGSAEADWFRAEQELRRIREA